MATYGDFQAAIDAIRRANPGWVLPPPPADNIFLTNLLNNVSPGNPATAQLDIPNQVFDWLRGQAPPGVFDHSGQIVNAPPGARPPDLPAPKASQPPLNIPGPPPGGKVNPAVAKPQNNLADHHHAGAHNKFKSHKGVPHDPTPSFLEGYKAFQDVTEHGPGNSGWNSSIENIKHLLENAIGSLSGVVTGQFADALKANLTQSLGVLADMSAHAQMMEDLTDAFFNDLATTKTNFAQNWGLYKQAAQHPDDPNSKETIKQLNDLAVTIMNTYRPPIDDISGSHPSIGSALPNVGAAGSPAGGAGGGGLGGLGGGVPAGLVPGGLNTGLPQSPAEGQPQQSQTPSAPTDSAKSAGDAAKQAGDQAQKAAGQGGDAAKKALSDTLAAAQKGTGGLPEGMLNLGSKGLGGGGRPGGSAGGRGAGGATGFKQPAKLATPPTVTGAGAPVSRAGLSGAGAGQGAGAAPAAGHRGGGADKAHKANKALRLTKNGEEVMGEVEGVTPVIGDAPRADAPADSKT